MNGSLYANYSFTQLFIAKSKRGKDNFFSVDIHSQGPLAENASYEEKRLQNANMYWQKNDESLQYIYGMHETCFSLLVM